MNKIAQALLCFDRFTLDLTRGCVRAPEGEIELRPKAFEVLRYLVGNAGRLISKQELSEAVWPDVIVSDDSLVQCIREVRDRLGDIDRRLIKTVPRRGYLLDATISEPALAAQPENPDVAVSEAPREVTAPAPRSSRTPLVLISAGVLLCAVVAFAYLIARPPAPDNVADRASVPTQAHAVFKDCDVCAEMVSLPAGEFMMGSPQSEEGRGQVEGLPRRVAIPHPFAIGRYEVTVEQFNAFLAETGTEVSNHCRLIDGVEGNSVTWGAATASFQQPGYEVTGAHPVDCVSWHEARAFAAWLGRRTGKPYRLPTEAEWEYAARAETTTSFSFGDDPTQLCNYARFADITSTFPWRGACRGETTSFGPLPIGQLKPNPWGLHDMHGNVWEWAEDCWTPNPQEIPDDGSAMVRAGQCEMGVIRGGSFASGYQRVRSAYRLGIVATRRDQNIGFRVALSLEK